MRPISRLPSVGPTPPAKARATADIARKRIAGDKVLRRASLTAQEALREGDVLARWGGEEFLVLLAGADLATGCAVAERCRKALADVTGVEAVTASFGVTPIASTDSVISVLRRADQALYHAKLEGRNQVAAASPSGTMLKDPLGML